MKSITALAVLLLPIAACSGEDDLVGSYGLERAAGAPMEGAVMLQLGGDGTFVLHRDDPAGGHSDAGGTWTREGNEITLTGTAEAGGAETTVLELTEDGNLVMVKNGEKWIFRRR